jgi:hypothetical protein
VLKSGLIMNRKQLIQFDCKMKKFLLVIVFIFVNKSSVILGKELSVAISSSGPAKVYESFLSSDQIKKGGFFDGLGSVDPRTIEKLCRESVSKLKNYPVDVPKLNFRTLLLVKHKEGDYYVAYFYNTDKPPEFDEEKEVMPVPKATVTWAFVCLADGTIIHPRF